MSETPQQYIERVLGYLEGRRPLEVLAATPGQLARLVKGVPRRRLAQRPGPDRWSATEVLAHLADSELVYGFRIRLILELPGTPIQSIGQDAWARFSDYREERPALCLEALRSNRERLVRLLKRLPPEGWEAYGMHSERGRESVARIAELLAGHDLAHMKQIRAALAGR